MFAERETANVGLNKNVSISRAIMHEGVWLLVSDLPRYQRVKSKSLILYMWPRNYFYTQKACSEGFKKKKNTLKARVFAHVFTWFHIMRKFGAHNDNSTGESHIILGAKNIRSFSLNIFILLKISDTSRNWKIWGYFFIPLPIQILT